MKNYSYSGKKEINHSPVKIIFEKTGKPNETARYNEFESKHNELLNTIFNDEDYFNYTETFDSHVVEEFTDQSEEESFSDDSSE